MDLYIVEIFCIFDDNEEEKSAVRVEGFREREERGEVFFMRIRFK